MDLRLSNADLDWQARARAFVETYLYPIEFGLEENGRLADDTHARIKKAVLDNKLNAFTTHEEFGGQGCNRIQQVIIREERGTETGEAPRLGRRVVVTGGGDMVPAERTVTVAVGHSKKAARNIDAYMRGATYEPAPKHALAGFERPRPDHRAVRGQALPLLRQLLRVRQLLRRLP